MFGAVPASWIQMVRVSERTGEIFPFRTYHEEGDIPNCEPDIHPDFQQILVFGSNTAGRHGKGAAKLAAQLYGAQEGIYRGRCGQSYAIPTRRMLYNRKIVSLSLDEIGPEVEHFVEYTRANPQLTFFVMGVGTGNAGYSPSLMAPLFRSAINCSFPQPWRKWLMKADRDIIDANPL
jgi:hypothetical protein